MSDFLDYVAWLFVGPAGPVVLLAILVPLSRTARWRLLVFPTLLGGVLLALATLLPWKHVTELVPLSERSWTARERTETGIASSWRGPSILALGAALSAISLWIGARPRSDTLARAAGLAAVGAAIAFAAFLLTAMDRFSVFDPDPSRSSRDAELGSGLVLAWLASSACAWFAVAMLLGLSKERVRVRGRDAIDPASLRRVFK